MFTKVKISSCNIPSPDMRLHRAGHISCWWNSVKWLLVTTLVTCSVPRSTTPAFPFAPSPGRGRTPKNHCLSAIFAEAANHQLLHNLDIAVHDFLPSSANCNRVIVANHTQVKCLESYRCTDRSVDSASRLKYSRSLEWEYRPTLSVYN
jgi:hypothetical protein